MVSKDVARRSLVFLYGVQNVLYNLINIVTIES